MTEQSIDQTRKALKAQREEKQAEDDRDAALTAKARADKALASAQSAERVIHAQREDVKRERAALIAQERSTDPTNEPAMRRLSAERSYLDTRLEALDGAAGRAKDAREKAETDVVKAEHALAQAEEILKKAKDHLTECGFDAEEARLIAAKEPLPQHLAERAARRERVEERQRQIENDWDWNDVRRLWDSGEAVLTRNQHDA